MVTIVFVSLAEEGIKQSASHVADKIGLSVKALKVSAYMRDHFFHENALGMLNQGHLIIAISSSQSIDVLSNQLKAFILCD